MGTVLATACLVWMTGWALLLGIRHRVWLRSLWNEPVLRYPVLIVESDDWGPGPEAHAQALERLAGLLTRYRDSEGRFPVVTLGVVLAIPDKVRIRESHLRQYHRRTLADDEFARVREAMRQGEESGVFALQLHGMEHYWPESVMVAAQTDVAVMQWLTDDCFPYTEVLPSPLQSRWTDASALPSVSLPDAVVQAAVGEEVTCFTSVFGFTPRVVVPPTFLWDERVERFWKAEGVDIVVTPGRRMAARDARGALVATGTVVNGQCGTSGACYVVRDEYFEPKFGHRPQRGIAALARKVRLARPALLEMHRFNLIPDAVLAEDSFQALDALLAAVLAKFPEVRFLSTEALAHAMIKRDPAIIERDPWRCTRVFVRRIWETQRLRKWLIVSGWGLFIVIMLWSGDRGFGRHACSVEETGVP